MEREYNLIYLDYTANAPVEERVLEAFCRAERHYPGNANARHIAGREANQAMARAAGEIAELLRRLSRDNPKIEQNIFNSIHVLQLDTMPGWKRGGVEHTFLEWYDGEGPC